MKILITRPLEDGKEIAARLAERGHEGLLAPLLTPRFYDGPEPDFKGVEAILATSANGIRAFVRRTPRRDFSVFAVGPQTAGQARKSGFTEVRNADGDAKALALAATLWAARKGVLLHVCGEDAPGTLAENLTLRGFTVRRCPLYAIESATILPGEARAALERRVLDGVMFFSPKSVRIFGALADGLPTEDLTAFCISPATAQALSPLSFGQVAVASRPNQAAMLALLG
ncbi:MAG TPA: uroporphyrinogen-III synthase [Rhizomicrobium sp.]|jgi:uroporphyrinogen-III synthase|nr:uroporphyrinogen-III synthase [Rhizomicrobium sp.]